MMNSKSGETAIISRLRSKRSDPTSLPRLAFYDAATEIAQALKIKAEAAAMTLYGLCATGNVRWFDDQGEVIDIDECTIAAFHGGMTPAFVVADDLRFHLKEWSPAPQRTGLEAEIEKRLQGGDIPGRNIQWKKFSDEVRDECNGWIVTGNERKPNRGFGDKQIQRIVKDLTSK